MNLKEIKKLMTLLEDSNLAKLHYKDDQFELNIEKPSTSMPLAQAPLAQAPIQEIKEENLIKAPLVGVFYTKPSEDKAPFVQVGQHINEGDVICIIEAMKVMNEIKSPKSGVLQEILLQDGDAVSYDEPLFKLA